MRLKKLLPALLDLCQDGITARELIYRDAESGTGPEKRAERSLKAGRRVLTDLEQLAADDEAGIHRDAHGRPYTDEIFHPTAYALFLKDSSGSHRRFTRADWRDDDTQRGYWSWLSARLEERDNDRR